MHKAYGLAVAPPERAKKIEAAKSQIPDGGFDLAILEENRDKFYKIARQALGLQSNTFNFIQWEQYRHVFLYMVRIAVDPLIIAALCRDASAPIIVPAGRSPSNVA